MPLGVLWVDGAFYFNAGPTTRKARNLAQDPHCVITVATNGFDLVVEGEAAKVTDDARLQRIAVSTRPKDGSRPCATAPWTSSSVRQAQDRPRGTCTR